MINFRTYMMGALITASAASLPLTAMAEPDCSEAKDLLNLVNAFYKADPEYTDVIDPQLALVLKAVDGFPDPSGIRYMYNDEVVDLTLDENGKINNLDVAVNFNDDGKLCKLVDGELVEEKDGDSVSLNMNFTFGFRNTSGEHDIETLKEGLKDGSKIMKALAPGGLGFVVPGLKALMLRPAEEGGTVPEMVFLSKGEVVDGLPMARVGDTQMVKMKALKKKKIDRVQIKGAYRLDGQFNYDEDDITKGQAAYEAKQASDAAMNTPSDENPL